MFGGFPFEFFESDNKAEDRKQEESGLGGKTRYYEVLGIEKNASTQEILKAYRNLARTKHPDKGGDPKIFAEITQAKDVLSDPEKRRIYDMEGKHDARFDFGPRSQAKKIRKCKNLELEVRVSLEELYHGCVKKREVKRKRNCTACEGKGGLNSSPCPCCDGTGEIHDLPHADFGPSILCNYCSGRGAYIEPGTMCTVCKGYRNIMNTKTLEIVVDKGTPNNHKQNYHGEGEEKPGFSAGDIVVKIVEENHQVFKRVKSDLTMTKTLTLKEALTGYSFAIKHLDGSEKIIESAKGEIVRHKVIRTVEELGMPIMRTPYKYGNLFITFEVEFPKPMFFSPKESREIGELLPGNIAEEFVGEVHRAEVYSSSHITENPSNSYQDYHEDEYNDYDYDDMTGGQEIPCTVF